MQKLDSEEAVAEAITGYDLVIDACDWPAHDIEHWINSACFTAGIAFIAMSHFPPIARVGPFYVPGVTGCFACQEAGYRRTYPLFDVAMEQQRGHESPAATLGPACGLIGGQVGLDIMHFLTGLAQPSTLGDGPHLRPAHDVAGTRAGGAGARLPGVRPPEPRAARGHPPAEHLALAGRDTRGLIRVRRVRGGDAGRAGRRTRARRVAVRYPRGRGWRSSDGMRRHPCARITRIKPLDRLAQPMGRAGPLKQTDRGGGARPGTCRGCPSRRGLRVLGRRDVDHIQHQARWCATGRRCAELHGGRARHRQAACDGHLLRDGDPGCRRLGGEPWLRPERQRHANLLRRRPLPLPRPPGRPRHRRQLRPRRPLGLLHCPPIAELGINSPSTTAPAGVRPSRPTRPEPHRFRRPLRPLRRALGPEDRR